MKRIIFLAVAVILLGAAFSANAEAHEKREVASNYLFIVGFLNEPAFSGEMNGLDLRIQDKNQKPVEGLEKTLTAKVIDPETGKSMDLKLKTRYKEPGAYAGHFLPVKPGTYVFLIEGNLNGKDISERFESGPGRFSSVEDSAGYRFPN